MKLYNLDEGEFPEEEGFYWWKSNPHAYNENPRWKPLNITSLKINNTGQAYGPIPFPKELETIQCNNT